MAVFLIQPTNNYYPAHIHTLIIHV